MDMRHHLAAMNGAEHARTADPPSHPARTRVGAVAVLAFVLAALLSLATLSLPPKTILEGA